MSFLQKLITRVENDPEYGKWIPKRKKFIRALHELRDMIGNESTKDDIAKQIMTLIRQPDDKDIMLNTVLCGPPGVGKTQIANKLALIFNSLGFLEKGKDEETNKQRGIQLPSNSTDLLVPLIFILSFLFSGGRFLYDKGGIKLLLGVTAIFSLVAYYIYTQYRSSSSPISLSSFPDKKERAVDDELVRVVSREDFISMWMGATPEKTINLLKSCHGKVLFIDEAYSLVKSERDQYGSEALDIINRYISEHPRNIIVILAGYRDKMNDLFTAQPGLTRRFMWNFDCSGYTIEELFQIFILQVKKRNLLLKNKDLKAIRKLFKSADQFPSQAGDTERLVNYCNIEHSGLDKEDNILDLEDVTLGMEKLQENIAMFNNKKREKTLLEQIQAFH